MIGVVTMRRIISVAILAIALAAGSLLLTSANADDRERDDQGSETIRLSLRNVDSAELDLGEEGFSLGDRFVFTDEAFRGGRLVGSAHGECTIVQIDGEDVSVQCLATWVLKKGQLTSQGVVTFSESDEAPEFTIAVTGGTGRYKDAGGEARVREISDTESRVRITLVD